MKDNYLWDRSGEVDAEIEELENLLGTLRYQPQPLAMPAGLQVGRRRTFFPALAIAAAIALVAAGLGLWLNLNRRPAQENEVKQTTETDQKRTVQRQSENKPDNRLARTSAPEKTAPEKDRKARSTGARNLFASNRTHRHRTETARPQLSPEEIAEKEQVLTALRLVSAKLNLAQRRTQGAPSLNPIRNQHKIG